MPTPALNATASVLLIARAVIVRLIARRATAPASTRRKSTWRAGRTPIVLFRRQPGCRGPGPGVRATPSWGVSQRVAAWPTETLSEHLLILRPPHDLPPHPPDRLPDTGAAAPVGP